MNQLPNYLLKQVETYISNDAGNTLRNAAHYILHQPNPIFQIIYLFIGLGSWSIYFAYAFPLIISSNMVPTWHVVTGFLTFISCMGSFAWACTVSPGVINVRTIPKFDNYEYDNLLFVQNRICPTANIRKLARSKYCRYTKRHIPRFDHFCGWLNQPVGEENYRYFLLFLGVQTFMCIYGSYVTALLFWEQIVTLDLLNSRFYNAVTNEEVPTSYFVVFNYLYATNKGIAGCFLLQIVLGFAFVPFLIFHLMLVCRNMTTNEFYKWRSVKAWHRKAKKNYLLALKEGRVGNKDKKGVVGAMGLGETLDNVDVGCTGVTNINTENNEITIKNDKNNDDEEDEMDDTMDPGPLPTNIYNIGLVQNVKEVLFPRSLRKDALIRWAKFVIEGKEGTKGVPTMKKKQKKKKN